MRLFHVVLALALLILSGASVCAEPITVVAFNVENLFDTEDDPTNPRYDTYLPLAVKQSIAGHNARCYAPNNTAFWRRTGSISATIRSFAAQHGTSWRPPCGCQSEPSSPSLAYTFPRAAIPSS